MDRKLWPNRPGSAITNEPFFPTLYHANEMISMEVTVWSARNPLLVWKNCQHLRRFHCFVAKLTHSDINHLLGHAQPDQSKEIEGGVAGHLLGWHFTLNLIGTWPNTQFQNDCWIRGVKLRIIHLNLKFWIETTIKLIAESDKRFGCKCPTTTHRRNSLMASLSVRMICQKCDCIPSRSRWIIISICSWRLASKSHFKDHNFAFNSIRGSAWIIEDGNKAMIWTSGVFLKCEEISDTLREFCRRKPRLPNCRNLIRSSDTSEFFPLDPSFKTSFTLFAIRIPLAKLSVVARRQIKIAEIFDK